MNTEFFNALELLEKEKGIKKWLLWLDLRIKLFDMKTDSIDFKLFIPLILLSLFFAVFLFLLDFVFFS